MTGDCTPHLPEQTSCAEKQQLHAAMPSKIEGKRVGFIGAGAMAEALAKGFIAKQVVDAKDIWCNDPSQARVDLFKEFGCNPAADAVEVSLYTAANPQGLSRLTCTGEETESVVCRWPKTWTSSF